MKSKTILSSMVVVAMLATGVAFAAMAHHGHWHHRPEAMGLFSPQIVAQLHLNNAQTQSLNTIRTERKVLFAQFRKNHEAMMADLQNALKSDTPDLRALAQQRNANMDQMRDNMRKLQNDELNLYGSLSDQQKLVVRNALLKRLKFMQQHWQHRHWQNPKASSSRPPAF